jgi:ligand-binding sensor domain-containing protein
LKLKYHRDTSFSLQLNDPELKEYFIDYYSNPLMFGNINFTSDPNGAEIFLNDSSIQAVTPFTLKNVKPGSYIIKYKKENHRDAIFSLIVESSKNSSSYFKLRDTSKWVDYQISNSNIPSNFITCIEVDLNNIKWMGSFEKGVISFNGSSFNNYSTANSPIPNNNIKCISIDQNNNKWVGTDAGIAIFNNSSWIVYNKSNSGLANNNINSIKFENNIAWIGTPSGLIKFDGVNWIMYDTVTFNPENEFASVNDLSIDAEGYKWLATSNSGIFKFKDGIFGRAFRDSVPGIPSNRSSTAAITSSGEKWFGHLPGPGKRGGVSIFNGSIWKTIFIGSEGNLIEDIYVDNSNTKWVSTNEGLFQIFGETPLFFYNRNNSLISFSHIKAVVKDKDGLIWVATYGGGLNKLKL